MNTAFWGPDAWNFLHCISANYPVKPTSLQKNSYRKFFNILKHILPCIYCRRSLVKYYREIPIMGYLSSGRCLRYWLFLIHNRVNNKLKKAYKNPTLKDVNKHYKKYHHGLKKGNYPGWDFIYCICFNYQDDTSLHRYKKFFTYLQVVLPYKDMRESYCEYLKENPIELENRTTVTKWFYNFEKKYKRRCRKWSTIMNTYANHSH